ncbi:MAG: ribonuclease D [Pseudomonadota bacterium]|nr:ribonuclease D [Pseudomonadota bacterium]MDE3037324.1 ribonuclease D [Pseudomonadota bacterium]
MTPITSEAELKKFCAAVEGGHYITVDTEFLRDKTYFPKLCLLQIAGQGEAAIIDPLAPGLDLKPVFALMQKKSLTKVFHAARQDIEIFHLLSGHIPAPIFDTQIAAAVCGYGESASYESLVNKIAGAEIDKSSRFTDWSARPLSEKQLKYALSDVTHLCTIYEDLKNKIEAMGRMGWIMEEHARLTDPAIYNADPNDAWKRLRFGNMRPKHLAALRELARWRETEARKADVPRGRIVKDETLVELAAALPRKENDLSRMRGMDRHLSGAKVAAILQCVEAALALPPADYPQVPRHHRPPENVTAALPMLQMLLKVTADAEGIAASIIAGKDDLEAIALKQDTPAMHGWRYDIFGQKAEALLEGKLKLSLDATTGKVVIEEI